MATDNATDCRIKAAEASHNDVRSAVADAFARLAPASGRAVLFGSRARGDARADSDWDVLVLLDKERITPADMDEVGYPLRELGWEMDAEINPVLYTVRDWESRRHTPFYKNVEREGVAL